MPEVDVTNKIAIPIAPLSIAMAHSAMSINVATLANSYFGPTFSYIMQDVADAMLMTVSSGKFVYANADKNPLRDASCIMLIDSHLNCRVNTTPAKYPVIDLVVKKRIDDTHSTVIDNLTKTFRSDVYGKPVVHKTKVGDYYAIPSVLDPIGAAQNDSVFNLLCKRLGVTINKSLHLKNMQDVFKDNLSRFTSD